jgi:hypothetical protein
MKLVARYLTRYTRPYLPFPNYFSLTKSSTLTFFGFFSRKGNWGGLSTRCSKLESTIRLLFRSIFMLLVLLRKEGACRTACFSSALVGWSSLFYSLFFRKFTSLTGSSLRAINSSLGASSMVSLMRGRRGMRRVGYFFGEGPS